MNMDCARGRMERRDGIFWPVRGSSSAGPERRPAPVLNSHLSQRFVAQTNAHTYSDIPRQEANLYEISLLLVRYRRHNPEL